MIEGGERTAEFAYQVGRKKEDDRKPWTQRNEMVEGTHSKGSIVGPAKEVGQQCNVRLGREKGGGTKLRNCSLRTTRCQRGDGRKFLCALTTPGGGEGIKRPARSKSAESFPSRSAGEQNILPPIFGTNGRRPVHVLV